MGLLSKLLGGGDDRLERAETYMDENTCLYRHYSLRGTLDSLDKAGVHLTEQEAAELVQKKRNENRLGQSRVYQRLGYQEEG